MTSDLKLHQILEKLNVETKIGVEIQDWIEDTFEKKQSISMFQFQETKHLPMQKDLKGEMHSLRSESDYKFEKLIFEMRSGFENIQKQMQADREVMEAKFRGVDSKFEGLNSKFEAIDVKFEAIDSKFESIDLKFDAINSKFDAVDSKFVSLEKRLDSTNFYLQLIAVPIVGATLSGVGVTFLYIWERLQ